MSIRLLMLQRLGVGLITILIVSLVVFIGTEILPGDVAQAILGQGATEESLTNMRARLGLDQPTWQRYLNWFGGLMQGDMGQSLATGKPVAEMIASRIGNTLMLAGITALIAVPLSVGLGLLASLNPNRWLDRTISSVSLVLVSVPDFFIAVLLVFIFAVQLGWLPALAKWRSTADTLTIAKALILPITALVFTVMAHMTRMTRTAVLGVLSSPPIEMAILKGVPRRRLLIHHALPNAIAPIVNVIALNLGYLISGVVVIESLFNFFGLGKMMVEAVATRDVPLVQGCAMIFCGIYVLLNMSADVISILANPRLRHPR